MSWQAEVGAGTARATDYRDFLTKLVAMATSQKVATVAVAAGGTGYVVGDVLTLTHAGAFLDARFEVTAETAGVITALRIISSGAFSNRVATVAVNVGGTGYAVNDIVEIQAGTSRERGKAQVTTEAAGVVTGVALFETGGAYSVAPGLTGATTVGIGPTGFAGDDALTLDLTMTGLTGLAALATTGGGNGDATVDITLAETGWAVDSRNTNNLTHNSLTDEKEVTLVGDASGFTNKPYAHFFTGSEIAGLDTRYFLQIMGSIAHNPLFPIASQPGLSPGYLTDNGGYMIFAQNQSSDSDFWFQIDDLHIFAETNPNPTPNTDDGQYLHLHAGFFDRLKTETEDPYPHYVFGSARDRDANPAVSSTSITSTAELRAPGNGPGYYYRAEGSVWTQLKNNDTGSVGARADVMFPFGEVFAQTDGNDAETVVADGSIPLNDSVIKRDRSASTRLLLPMPGSTEDHPLYDLVLNRKIAQDASELSDSSRGTLRGVFWIYNSDSVGAAFNNFSEDFITVGTNRYRVFHNHVFTDRYQYIAVLEDV